VSQSALATGLKLMSLDSHLGSQVPSSGAQANIKDSGQWHLKLQDDQGQSLALDGTLDYQVEGQIQADASSTATIMIAGTLKNNDAAVSIDALVSGGSSNGHTMDSGKFDATLTRNGNTSHTLITKTVDTAQIGYNLNRIKTQNIIERDGQQTG